MEPLEQVSDPWVAFGKVGAPASPAAASAATTADPWTQFGKVEGALPSSGAAAKQLGENALSFVKQVPTGLVHGGEALVGAPGDIRDAILSGVQGLHSIVVDALGLPPERATELEKNLKEAIERSVKGDPTLAATIQKENPQSEVRQIKPPMGGLVQSTVGALPTSQEVRTGVEKMTKGTPLEPRKPENLGADLGEAAGENAIGMVGPGGPVRKLATQVALPSIGGVAAERAAPPESKGLARAVGTVGGGIGGAAIGAAGTTIQAMRKFMPNYVTDQHVTMAEQLMRSAEQQGVHLTWPEALSQVTNRPVLADLQRILESAGRSRGHMQDHMAGRPHEIDVAGNAALDQLGPVSPEPSMLGPQAAEAAGETLDAVRGTINAAAQPHYTAAEGGLLSPREMAPVIAHPSWAAARDAVRNDPQLNRYVAHLPDNSVGFLNEVKKYINQQAEHAATPYVPGGANQQRVAGLSADAASIRNAAATSDAEQRIHPATGQSHNYETALTIESDLRRRYLEPLTTGPLGKIANHPDTQTAINYLFPAGGGVPGTQHEVATAVAALAHRNPQAAEQLVRAHAQMVFDRSMKSLQGGPNEFGGAKFAVQIAGNPQQREVLRAAVEALPGGQGRWEGFERFLEVAEATGRRQQKGSLTAFNAQELEGMKGGSAMIGAAKLGGSPGKWMTAINDKLAEWQQGRNLDGLARMITDPGAGDLLRRIARLPPDNPQALLLSARLAAQARTSQSKEEER